ncbi:MAG: 4Fe-4S dicluster domain-containing protein [Promethearchaeota archaeon]
MATVNFSFRNTLLKDFGLMSLSWCYQCATCTGGCPVAKETDGQYNPRRLIERSLLGLQEKLVNDPVIWLCTLCETCDEACPQNVKLTDIFAVLRNMAVKAGNVPNSYKAQSTSVYKSGLSIPFMDAIIRRRRDLGLEEKLEENIQVPLEELQKLMEVTGFKDIIEGYDKDTDKDTGKNPE